MNIMRSILNTEKWMNPRLIPRTPNFYFTARLNNGRTVRCQTYRKEFSIGIAVRIVRGDDIAFKDIQDWAGF